MAACHRAVGGAPRYGGRRWLAKPTGHPLTPRLPHSCLLQFGVPLYGGTLTGAVVYAGSLPGAADGLGCKEYGQPLPTQPSGLPTVLLVDRGGEAGGSERGKGGVAQCGRSGWNCGACGVGDSAAVTPPLLSSHGSHADCFFVQKAYYGQLAGAQAVLVTDHTEASGQLSPLVALWHPPCIAGWPVSCMQPCGESSMAVRCTWAAVLASAGLPYHHASAASGPPHAGFASIAQEGLLTMAVPEDRPEVTALVPKISIPVVLVTKASSCFVVCT